MKKKQAKTWLKITAIWFIFLCINSYYKLTQDLFDGIFNWVVILISVIVFVQFCRAVLRYMRKLFKKTKYYYGLYCFFTVGSGSTIIGIVSQLF